MDGGKKTQGKRATGTKPTNYVATMFDTNKKAAFPQKIVSAEHYGRFQYYCWKTKTKRRKFTFNSFSQPFCRGKYHVAPPQYVPHLHAINIGCKAEPLKFAPCQLMGQRQERFDDRRMFLSFPRYRNGFPLQFPSVLFIVHEVDIWILYGVRRAAICNV